MHFSLLETEPSYAWSILFTAAYTALVVGLAPLIPKNLRWALWGVANVAVAAWFAVLLSHEMAGLAAYAAAASPPRLGFRSATAGDLAHIFMASLVTSAPSTAFATWAAAQPSGWPLSHWGAAWLRPALILLAAVVIAIAWSILAAVVGLPTATA